MSDDSLHCGNLPDFPTKLKFAAGGLLGGKPLICGGLVESGSNPIPTDECYIYEANSWIFFTSMNHKRQGTMGVTVDEKTFWIIGKEFSAYLLTQK